MAVFEQTYKPYEGRLTPEWSRFLIIPRHAYRDVFRSKIFTAFFALSFVWPLVCAIVIYLHYNVDAQAVWHINVRDLLPIDANFFEEWLVVPQGIMGFFLAMLVGPQQVSRDLTNNALPLYFSRPLTRWSYALARLSVIAGMLSVVTWIPGLLLFALQVGLAGGGWFVANWTLGAAVVSGFLLWVVVLSLVAMASSAWVKWRVVAGAITLACFFILTGVSEMIDKALGGA